MVIDGKAWIEQLPDEMAGQRMLLRGLLRLCEEEEIIRWLVIGCSLALGAGDYLSDLDLAMGVRDEQFEAVVPEISTAVECLGDLVDSYQHKLPSVMATHMRIFAQYTSDRCQLDLMVFPASASAEPFAGVVALYDPDAVVLTRAYREPPAPTQVREWAFHGWCALADAGKYLRRGSMWEALNQLNAARDQLWRLQAVADRVPDPQFGLTSILDFAPGTVLPAMAGTAADLDPARLVSATRHLAALLSQAGQQLPEEETAVAVSRWSRNPRKPAPLKPVDPELINTSGVMTHAHNHADAAAAGRNPDCPVTRKAARCQLIRPVWLVLPPKLAVYGWTSTSLLPAASPRPGSTWTSGHCSRRRSQGPERLGGSRPAGS